MVDRLYSWVTSHRNLILRLFWLVFFLLLILITVGYRAIVIGLGDFSGFSEIGAKAADIAVAILIATAIPGIFRRFHISHKLVMLLMIFRRQLGIATFFFALVHVCFTTVFPEIRANAPLIATDPQNLAGWTTFILLIPLFVTSNNISIRALGVWWHRIHALMYGIIFVLAFHVFFSGEESWLFLTSVTGVSEVVSFMYENFRRR
jgi:methionine sulfoxide reductase heme-binding subunit